MKKCIIIGINLGDRGSTGMIMRNSLEYANKHGDFDYLVVVPKDLGKPNTYAYFEQNNLLDKIDRRFFHKSLGNPDGLYEYRATKRIIKIINEKCKEYNSVIIHLHNIHMASIDFRILFSYLAKKKDIKSVFYTIHDCWPYTGGCYYYNFINCNLWQDGCKSNCPQNYGNKYFNVSTIYGLKSKYTLPLVEKMTIIPVSNWLSNELGKSYLKDFKRVVINGETNITYLGYKDTNLINSYSLNNKRIVLAVADYWNDWKGVKYIYKVAEKLPKDYVVVVVGGAFDTKGYDNLLHIKNVSQDELRHYYSIADVYMSTSQNESLGLTTCEAQICGVPVVAFGHTAIKETFTNKTGICVGEDNDVDKMVKAIITVVENKPFNKKDIIDNGNKYVKYTSSKKYYSLYLKAVENN